MTKYIKNNNIIDSFIKFKYILNIIIVHLFILLLLYIVDIILNTNK